MLMYFLLRAPASVLGFRADFLYEIRYDWKNIVNSARPVSPAENLKFTSYILL